MKTIRYLAAAALAACSAALACASDRTGTCVSNGLVGEYYASRNLQNGHARRIDASVNLRWKDSVPDYGFRADNFSAVWRGQLVAKATGVHSFRCKTAGGARVMLDDTLIINRWNRPGADLTGKYYLEAGRKYMLMVAYQSFTADAGISLAWACPPAFGEEIIPARNLVPKLVPDGLAGTYYEDADFTGPLYTQTDPGFSFDWGTRAPFSAEWAGTFEAKAGGSYNFTCDTDGDARVIVNGAPFTAGSAPLRLQEGQKVPVTVRYAHTDRAKKARLSIPALEPASLYPGDPPDRQNGVIYVDAGAKLGALPHFWDRCVGSDHAAMLLRQDMKDQLKTLQGDLRFGALRFHGILDDDIGICRAAPEGRLAYSWDNADKVYDLLLSQKARPFVEFGYMPAALASGGKTVFFYKGNVTPPSDYGKWKELVAQCVSHWKERYGLDEIRNWRFEVWNEPNYGAFWAGTQEDYFRLYKYAAEAVKSVDPSLKVGGPASAGMGEWVKEFVDYCRENKVPVDFISTHGYPWDKGRNYDRDRDLDYPASKYFFTGLRETRNKMEYSGIPSLKEVHITEWGVNGYDLVSAAPYICHAVKDVRGFADTFSFWCYSDIFEEMNPVQTKDFPGIFGLMNVHGLKKASYNAFLLLGKMGDTELKTGMSRPDIPEIEAWSSMKVAGAVQVLVWNYSSPEDFKSTDRNVRVKVRNLPFGNAEVTRYTIDGGHGDVYGYWLSAGSPERFSDAQLVEARRRQEIGVTKKETVRVNGGGLNFDLYMPANSVSLLTIEPAR